MDQHGDERHHRDHNSGQRIVSQCPDDVEMACLNPGTERNGPGLCITADKLEAGEWAEGSGHQHAEYRYGLRSTVANGTAEQARDQRTEQRREDGDGVNHLTLSSG